MKKIKIMLAVVAMLLATGVYAQKQALLVSYSQTDNVYEDEYIKAELVRLSLKITNKTFLKAEVVEVSVTPMDGDMLQMGQNQAVDLDSGKSIGLTTTILTTKEGHNVREGTVTYYFWGIPFSRRITLK
jgi:hypothetical protein